MNTVANLKNVLDYSEQVAQVYDTISFHSRMKSTNFGSEIRLGLSATPLRSIAMVRLIRVFAREPDEFAYVAWGIGDAILLGRLRVYLCLLFEE